MPRALTYSVEERPPASSGKVSAGFWNWLFRPRAEQSFGRMEAVVLAIYSAVLAITIPFHEQWADEAQAWLIARDSSLFNIFYRRLHYEGTPGLWHLMLWFATRLHLPYGSINWISALCAATGIYVFLRFAPFPPLLRYILPFTFWLQFQYAVTARSYSLVPLFAFALCALFFREKPRPVLFALLAGLMANLSLYSALWAGILALLYAWRLWTQRRRGGRVPSLGPAVAVVCGMFLFALYTAWPAPDLLVRGDGAAVFAHSSPLRDKLIPPTPAPPGWNNKADFTLWFPKAAPDTTLYTRGNAFQRRLIKILHPTATSYRAQTWGHRISRLMIGLNALMFSISRSNLLGLALLVTCIVWLAMRRSLRFAIPLLLMFVLGVMTYINDHHAGLLFLSIVCALWLSWPERVPESKGELRTYQLLVVLLFAVAIEQAAWSAGAVRAEIREPFDPGRATARFLEANAAGKRVVGLGYETVSAIPFLPANPFLNQPTTYWMYSENFIYWKRIPNDLAMHPDFFIVGAQYLPPDSLADQIVPEFPPGKVNYAVNPAIMEQNGYRELTRFCGRIFMRGSSGVLYCNIVFVPAAR